MGNVTLLFYMSPILTGILSKFILGDSYELEEFLAALISIIGKSFI